ncbi:N-acetylmuramoyl-L-alanine amidase [Halothermothrix orenii]|uniref:N-acetylmuramoyl-L-alanine amidase n=1 Tax=Halothermothrix orenii (strain H 168 / OCM 544 / DSM 9562) TaxID=373903 RepID=B8CW82_HALOH|nr:N-acetylmuramoyl-L-alanine amidase [Halothermothrix orenii]ACL69551.1 N-acetylmuramoyl-L-alanine amidase [Halothermothrix orenii H 168]
MFLILKLNKKIIGLLLGGIVLATLLYFSLHSIPTNTKDMVFKVVVDPGHGSIDTGTHHGNIFEKDINLEIARHLVDELKKVNIIPIMTRNEDKLYQNDRNKDLKHRPEIAREYQADLFISIHINNFPTSQPSGSQVFYKPDSSESKELAKYIHEELVMIRQENNRSLSKGNYYVLKQSPCPAVLIEAGFISNPVDRKKLTDPEYQKNLARAITKGIINYLQSSFGNPEKPTTDGTPTIKKDKKGMFTYYIGTYNGAMFLVRKELSYPTAVLLNKKYSGLKLNEIMAIHALNQLKTSPDGLVSPLPKGTRIKSLTVKRNVAVVNFSRELKENFKGGGGLENYTVEAITRTLFSVPGIEAIDILIEGETNQTIGGHIILNRIIKD